MEMLTTSHKSVLFSKDMIRDNRLDYSRVCGVIPFVVGLHPKAEGRSKKWSKVAWLMDLLRRYDTVLWLDADAFIVKPKCAWLKHNKKPVSISYDQAQGNRTINTGVMVLRNTSLSLLSRVWENNDDGKGESDQRSFNKVLRREDVHILPPKFNSFPVPVRQCPGFLPPPKLKDQDRIFKDAVVRHFAGQYGGGRVMDGKVVKCAWNQLDVVGSARALNKFEKRFHQETYRRIAVLTSLG